LPRRFPSHPQTKRRLTLNPSLRRLPEGIGRDAAPVGCTPRRRSETPRAYAGRERGRHPTDARQVVPKPRRAAGSTVVASWRRLFPCTQAQPTAGRPKKSCDPLLTLEVIATLRLSRARKPQRSGGWRASAAGGCSARPSRHVRLPTVCPTTSIGSPHPRRPGGMGES
jgi:hypothetical protein